MNSSFNVKHLDPKRAVFGFLTPDEVRNMSVVNVCVPVSFNALGYPMKNGLYDPLMGPADEKSGLCSTCKANYFVCPGHFGHIELPLTLFNPLFVKTVYQMLRFACLSCYRLQMPTSTRVVLSAQMRLLDAGRVIEAQELGLEAGRVGEAQEPGDEAGSAETRGSRPASAAEEDALGAFLRERLQAQVDEVLASEPAVSGKAAAAVTRNVEAVRSQCHAAAMQQFRRGRTCACKKELGRISIVQNRIMITMPVVDPDTRKVVSRSEPTFITAEEARNHLRRLWQEGGAEFMVSLAPALANVTGSCVPPDIFFLQVVPVPPPRTRPLRYLAEKKTEHPQSLMLQEIVQNCVIVRTAVRAITSGPPGGSELTEEGQRYFIQMKGDTPEEKLHLAWQTLQASVDRLADADRPGHVASGKEGLKQLISKKEGLVRMHMMGKRVNFAARSVITPDPNLGVDEIGVPEAFARTLTFPTPVTPWNVMQLRNAVLAGPDQYPGAVAVRLENGMVMRIAGGNSKEAVLKRKGLAKRLLTPADAKPPPTALFSHKVVMRHLRSGDMLLLNRQPTLHRPSIMAHRARVLHGERTLRMHYANCKSYNADFDGDEMNAHFPQSEVARAEAMLLADVSHQYLVPKDGSPLGGLIQVGRRLLPP